VAGRPALVLGDQLSYDNPARAGADRVLLAESRAKLTSGRFHRQSCTRNLDRIDSGELRRSGREAAPCARLRRLDAST
jgi:hypothetical protein